MTAALQQQPAKVEADVLTRRAGGPASLLSTRIAAQLCGASYYGLLRAVASGRVHPDAVTSTGAILFREDRLPELQRAFARGEE